MAKQTGLGDNLYVGGRDLSGDIGSVSSISGGPSTRDVTGIDKSAVERLGGRRDGSLEFAAFFNDAALAAHPTLAALPTSDVIVSYFRGTTLGNASACLVAKQLDYGGNRNEDGSLTFKVGTAANGYGLEWGRMLTAGRRADTGATNGTGVDFSGASSFGLQAYLHVFSFSGTDATVKLQESSDNGGGDAFADVTGGGFAQITSGPTSERIATSAVLAVERYLRVVTTTSGGFTALNFAVVVARNATATVF